ncbi:hypothetical protein OMP38_06260 [Cohnella ginsengisoli]|uniref:Uncharacterized protein n=1 Tax=Cohnella ginsengisoli TaxID=425004 RepID=A0A9X4KF82_9BACL|nr:hypothetical protein [Cohnella ginsengisoli]MDG0790494.1 hypothetical protein [Cohnella ginsengisoli]
MPLTTTSIIRSESKKGLGNALREPAQKIHVQQHVKAAFGAVTEDDVVLTVQHPAAFADIVAFHPADFGAEGRQIRSDLRLLQVRRDIFDPIAEADDEPHVDLLQPIVVRLHQGRVAQRVGVAGDSRTDIRCDARLFAHDRRERIAVSGIQREYRLQIADRRYDDHQEGDADQNERDDQHRQIRQQEPDADRHMHSPTLLFLSKK